MPYYEFACESCGNTEEHLHAISERSNPDWDAHACVECGKPMIRVPSAAAFLDLSQNRKRTTAKKRADKWFKTRGRDEAIHHQTQQIKRQMKRAERK